jgi:hypothetical protein
MVFAGLAVAVLGFVISFMSLGVASDVTTRMIMVLVGIGVSLFGVLGLVGKAYLKDAIWKK